MKNICDDALFKVKTKVVGLYPFNHDEEQCLPGHAFGPGVRLHYLIHYIISGTGVYYCGPNKYTLTGGQLFVIYPGTIVKYEADMSDPWRYSWITFGGEECSELLRAAGITPANPVITPKNAPELRSVLDKMPTECGDDLSDRLHFTSLLYELMSIILESNTTAKKAENVYFRAAVRYIKSHFHEDLSVESVSEHIGISRKYLFSLFKATSGKSVQGYIVDYRMKKACELLKNRDVPIGNVAYSVGYRDPLVFSKMFKRRMGVSPTEYRNK